MQIQKDKILNNTLSTLYEKSRKGKDAVANRKTCLIVEGGAMRGVFSGGMMLALQKLKLANGFDNIYGVSAGALSAVYFASEQAHEGLHIYYNYINNNNFINPFRFLSTKPIISLSYLVDHIYINKVPLNTKKILEDPSRFRVLATSIRDRKSHIITDYRDESEILTGIKCSSNVPLLAGKPLQLRDHHYWDAAVTEPLPIEKAANDGCTDIFVLLTRPRNTYHKNKLIDFVIARHISKTSKTLAKEYLKSEEKRFYNLNILPNLLKDKGVNITIIEPPAYSAKFSNFEKRAEKLNQAAKDGEVVVYEKFKEFFPKP